MNKKSKQDDNQTDQPNLDEKPTHYLPDLGMSVNADSAKEATEIAKASMKDKKSKEDE